MTPAYRPMIVRLPLDHPSGARQCSARRMPAERYDGTSPLRVGGRSRRLLA
jgi:hypothetical protein